jgi:hypothetical protein
MARIGAVATFVGVAFLVTACTGSSATSGPSGSPGSSPSPSPTTAVVIVGPPSTSPSSAASPSGAAGSPAPSQSSTLACDVIDQATASAAVGIPFPVGKPVSPKLSVPLTYRNQCIYTNGASPATNLTVDIGLIDPTYSVTKVRDKIISEALSKVGTNNGVTFTASEVMIDGNPGLTSLLSGAGVNNTPIHIETAEYWNGTTAVTIIVGNGPAGAAVALANAAAGKL